MRQKINILLSIFTLSFGLFFITAPTMAAASPVDPLEAACKTAPNSPNCPKTTENPLTGPNGVLMKVTRIIAVIAGVVAIIIIVLSGIRYMTSNGDPKKAGDAKNAVIGALIGLVIIALSSLIIMFVIQRI